MAHTTHYDVLIIGAGLSGIGTACHIRKEHPQRSLAIIERRARLGGTWPPPGCVTKPCSMASAANWRGSTWRRPG